MFYFKNVCYSIKAKKEARRRKLLLSDVTGDVQRGEILCILGHSGSGKTTLLEILTGRMRSGEVCGEFRLDSKVIEWPNLCQHVSYVEQHPIFIDMFTVKEHLMYEYCLRQASQRLEKDANAAVCEIMDMIGIRHIEDVRIGNRSSKGISGGERKLLSIALEVIWSPRILALDEPTSGLDTVSSLLVMQHIKDLKDMHEMSLLMAIHAPAEATLNMISKMTILKNGRQVFYGTKRDAIDLIGENNRLWNQALMDANLTVADHLMFYFQTTTANEEDQASVRAHADINSTFFSGLKVQAWVAWRNIRKTKPPPFNSAFSLLIKFRLSKKYKCLSFIVGRLIDKVVFALFMSILYNGVGSKDTLAYFPENNFLANALAITPFASAIQCIGDFVQQQINFTKEATSGLYSASAYIAYKMAEESLILLPAGVLISGIIYPITELRFGIELLIFNTILQMILGTSFALMLSGIGSPYVRSSLIVAFNTIFFLMNGIAVRVSTMPVYVRWIVWINPMFYSSASIIQARFGGDVWTQLTLVPGSITSYYSYPAISSYWLSLISFAFIIPFLTIYWISLRFFHM